MALMHPQFDPVALSLGPVAIHWYGLMYLAAFAQFLLLGRLRVKQAHWQSLGMNYQALEDLLFKGVLGVIVGGRLGMSFFTCQGTISVTRWIFSKYGKAVCLFMVVF